MTRLSLTLSTSLFIAIFTGSVLAKLHSRSEVYRWLYTLGFASPVSWWRIAIVAEGTLLVALVANPEVGLALTSLFMLGGLYFTRRSERGGVSCACYGRFHSASEAARPSASMRNVALALLASAALLLSAEIAWSTEDRVRTVGLGLAIVSVGVWRLSVDEGFSSG